MEGLERMCTQIVHPKVISVGYNPLPWQKKKKRVLLLPLPQRQQQIFPRDPDSDRFLKWK